MAIVGLEMDQVRKGAGPNGEDVSLPITLAYNHHHDTAVVGADTELEEVDMHDPRIAQSPYGGHVDAVSDRSDPPPTRRPCSVLICTSFGPCQLRGASVLYARFVAS